jgi:RES domain
MRYICFNCFDDEHLQRIIKGAHPVATCTKCGTAAEAISIKDLGKLIEPVMRQHYQLGEEVRQFGEDDRDWYEQQGEDMSYIVQDVLGQHFDFEDEIIDAVIDADECWEPDGDMPFWDTTSNYEPVPVRHSAFATDWHLLLEELKHGRRFFSPAAKEFFDKVFCHLDRLTAWVDGARIPVLKDLPPHTKLFRARQCLAGTQLNAFFKDPLGQVGPPPSEHSRSGRMNPEGITVLYSSLEVDTCLAELRPALGSRIALITMETVHPLRLLDFNLLDIARHPDSLSYFQDDFDEQVELRVFLHRLHRMIANPVAPGHESDYLITQVMTEYLAHVCKHQLDGIQFRSSQKSDGNNVVLFSKSAYREPALELEPERFPIRYVVGSLELHETQTISYTHRKLSTYEIDGRVVVTSTEDYEDWESC